MPSPKEFLDDSQDFSYLGFPEGDKDRPSKVVAGQAFRGAVAGIADIPNEVKNLYDWAAGNPYEDDQIVDLKAWGLKTEEDEGSLVYEGFKFGSQFLIPYAGINKGLKGIAGIKAVKGLGMSSTAVRSFTAGAATDFVAFDAYDGNMFNALQETKYKNVVFEYLEAKSPEEESRAHAKLKQLVTGGIFGEVVGFGLKGTGKLVGKGWDAVRIPADEKRAIESLNLMKLFEDIKGNPKRLEKFIKRKNAFDKKLLNIKDGVRSQFDDYLRETADEVYATSDNIDNLGDEIIPDVPLTKQDINNRINDLEVEWAIHQRDFRKEFPDVGTAGGIEPNSLPPERLKKYQETVGRHFELRNEISRLQDELNTAPRGAITPEVIPAADTELGKIADRIEEIGNRAYNKDTGWMPGNPRPEKLSDQLRDMLKHATDKEAKELRKIDELLKKSRAIGYETPTKATGRQKILPGTAHPTIPGKVRGYDGRWVTKKHFDQVTESRKGANEIRAQFDQPVDAGGGGAAVPPRKPPSGSGSDVPPVDPDDDLIKKPSKPIGYNRNPRVFGPRQADIDFTARELEVEAKINERYPTTMSDDYVIALGEQIPSEDLKARIRYGASRMRGMEDKKALRVSYQKALREQKRLTIQLVDSTKAVEDALLVGKQDMADEILDEMAKAYFDVKEFYTPVKTIGAEAAAITRTPQLIDKPVTKRIPISEELKKTWTTSERIAKDQAGNKTTKELVEAATKDIDEQALIPTKEEIFEAIKKAKDTGDIEGIVNLTRKIQAMQGDPNKIGKLFESTNLWTKTRDGAVKLGRISNELFINSILSAPETHIVNVVGSLFNVAFGPADLFLGSPLKDKTLKGRAAYELMSMFTSLEESLKMAGKAIYLDRNLLDERRMFGRDGNSRYAIRMDPDQKTFALRSLAKVVNWGGHGARSFSRLMLGGDEFVKNVAFRSHLKGTFAEQATRAGLKGTSWDIYVNSNFDEVIDIVNKQSVKPGTYKNILKAYTDSLDYAAEKTFTNELGKGYLRSISKPLADILKSGPMKPITPFVTTPVNIGKTVMRRTGVQIPGLGSKGNITLGRVLKEHNDRLLSPDDATRFRAQGEAHTAGLIWAILISKAIAAKDPEADWTIIGGGHHNKWRRENEMRTGELPYSLRAIYKYNEDGTESIWGDGEIVRGADGLPKYEYIDIFSRLEPVASMIMIAGDYADYHQYMSLDDEKEAAGALRALGQRNLENKYMIQGIANLFEGFSNPKAFLKPISNYVAGVTSFPKSMLSSIKRARGEKWTTRMGEGQTKVTYKGRFPKKKYDIRSGDLTQQELRDDAGQYDNQYGSLKDTSEPFFGNNLLDTLGLQIMRGYADGIPGYSADIEPIVSPTTGKVVERASGIGTDWFNFTKSSTSTNNPVDTFVRRTGATLLPPDDIIGENIKLDSKEYNRFRNLIPFVKIDGERFPERLYELSKNKDYLDALDVMENGGEDSPDSQAKLKLRRTQAKILRAEVTRLYNEYVQAAEEHYLETILKVEDPDRYYGDQNEQQRAIDQLILENE